MSNNPPFYFPNSIFSVSCPTCPSAHLFNTLPVPVLLLHLFVRLNLSSRLGPSVSLSICSLVHFPSSPAVYMALQCLPVCSVHFLAVQLATCRTVYLFSCLPVHLYVAMSRRLIIHLSPSPPVLLSSCPTIHPSFCPAVKLSTSPPVHLSNYPPFLLSSCSIIHPSSCPAV